MSIFGIGIDVVEIARIERSVERFGDRFTDRIFLAGELAYAGKMKHPPAHLAARFAAKEAVSKAFGTGIGGQVGWRDIEVGRKASGEPFITLHGNGRDWARRMDIVEVLVSLTHTEHYAAAQAVALLGNA